jgi:hypothetical protein
VTHESRSQIWRKPREPEMVYVPAGPFLMGSPKSDRLRDDVEPVQFELNLDYDYAIGKYPVTVGQYRAFVDAGGYRERRFWTRAGWQHNSNRIHPDHWTDRLWAGDDNLPVVGSRGMKRLLTHVGWLRQLDMATGCRPRPSGRKLHAVACNCPMARADRRTIPARPVYGRGAMRSRMTDTSTSTAT